MYKNAGVCPPDPRPPEKSHSPYIIHEIRTLTFNIYICVRNSGSEIHTSTKKLATLTDGEEFNREYDVHDGEGHVDEDDHVNTCERPHQVVSKNKLTLL